MDMAYPDNDTMDKYPYVYFTADQEWNPSIADDEFEKFWEDIFDEEDNELAYTSPVNDFGELTGNLEYDIDVMLMEVKNEYTLLT
jgi:hypothetical protein